MRRSGAWAAWGAGALLGLVALAACSRGDAHDAKEPVEVLVAPARLGSIPDQREYVGNVRARNRVAVRARVRGYLIEKAFDDGQQVKEGQLLFKIDPSTYRVALAAARGDLARARADAKVAELDFERAKELQAQNVVSTATLDQRRGQRDAAAAAVASAEAAVAAAELNLSYCTVTAPLTGRVGRALVDVGNLVGESGDDTVLADIVQEDPIDVYFAPTEADRLTVLQGAREGRIPEERAGHIPVTLRLGDGTPYPHPGVVDYVDPTIEATRGTLTVRAVVPNPEGELKPGQFVHVIATFPEIPDAVLVPQRAILSEQGGSYVLVVDDQDKVSSRVVVAGGTHDGLQQVVSGLSAGERVIVEGVQKARPGDTVVAKPLGESVAEPAAAPAATPAG